MPKQQQIAELIKMKDALSKGEQDFMLLQKLNDIISYLQSTNQTDTMDITNNLEAIKKYMAEPITVDINIV